MNTPLLWKHHTQCIMGARHRVHKLLWRRVMAEVLLRRYHDNVLADAHDDRSFPLRVDSRYVLPGRYVRIVQTCR